MLFRRSVYWSTEIYLNKLERRTAVAVTKCRRYAKKWLRLEAATPTSICSRTPRSTSELSCLLRIQRPDTIMRSGAPH